MLTDSAWEKRIRRTLDKCGLSLHKLRGGKGYIIHDGDIEEGMYFPSLDKLEDHVEYLRERYA